MNVAILEEHKLKLKESVTVEQIPRTKNWYMNLTVVLIIIGVLGTASNILAVRMTLENCEKELKIITKITTNNEDSFWILRKKCYLQ